ncbi:MAG: DUF4349 domain-containing protein [Saprospiraceae bacterium]|nr:DUF4349 domain-containing protein [Saprospiraceae bacterium]MCF8250800.1 DUF4349 domain-containing protein [Saprospiraceae bacterium]MCF8283008.1 DUF4349 domain-containing protein [Bacteroidales bacterium]MCF8312601.1 DUF4349 domain-containing protein [Saprospiraceae bacterium]MCF8440930.1 DUF4349 domain-containing protein [Saprospiraceae bacterium]
MKQSIFRFAIFSILLFATACQNRDQSNFSPEEKAVMNRFDGGDADASPAEVEEAPQNFDASPPTPPQQPGGGEQPNQPLPDGQPVAEKIVRQIIKTANYRIQVKDVNASSRNATNLATKHGGYVSDSELTNSSYETTNILTIRVPATRFDSLLDDLGSEAIFTQYKRINSQDVTEEYVDITTRLKTKIAVRDRYVDILRTKAKTVRDVLDAEEQIRIIQEEIEAKEGRLRYLKDQVGMSTIRLELYQSIEYRPEPDVFHESFLSKLGSGLKNGWELMQGLVIGLVSIWPLVLLFGFFFWKRRWIWSKIRRKQA